MEPPELPKEMQAIQVVAYKSPYEIRSVPVPTDLQPFELLVKVAVASNCHTDSMVQQGVFNSPLPQTASHEGAGTVVRVGGKEAEERGFKVGDRVMIGLGVTTQGCFASYVRADSRSTTPLPNSISFLSAAPLACAGRTVWRSILQTGLEKGQWICFVGSGGGLGHLGVQFGKALGLKVIGVDARDEGLELTKSYGADVVVDARKGKEEAVKAVQEVTGGEGADATVCISDAASAAGLACAVTRMHGTMVQVAQPDEVVIPFPELIFRDIRVKGSLICSEEESRGMLKCIAEHGVTAKTVPFHGLEKIGELTDLVHGGKIQGKAVIIVDEEQIEEEKKLGAKF
ncbi:hypothetical protein LTS16_001360 [Friedmanniomyces endolithicus]|uniref:Enoyl reductase (ER) domain-containing protein n=1 Tax=Friedmanniomyces endolithicus TaxID=329885 RepID=A0AAN6FCX5_9PEZI|nr:hypothetical protein LTR82_012791 [Friedmanniomyces endolithicus]KAK1011975.1 hypothetical protein LTR54_004830 [Friedmanniomyces endolithicus]KAK1052937.1 hypothetical protein LTS16_001360 [Friedmanniomyces endolithicus]